MRGLTAICWTGIILFSCYASTRMIGAGDTWVALACGRHIAYHGVGTRDPFSFNSLSQTQPPCQPSRDASDQNWVEKWHPAGWVNQNWLSHLFFYRLVTLTGSKNTPCYSALVLWKLFMCLCSAGVIYATGRGLGLSPLMAAASACTALVVGRSFLDIRPAAFSNLFSALLILILAQINRQRLWCIWMLIPLTLVWSNLHGGYVYLFIVLIPFFLSNLIGLCSGRFFSSIGVRALIHTVLAGIGALGAMIAFGPFHLTNITHVLEISLGKDAQRWRIIPEWRSIFYSGNALGEIKPFVVMILTQLIILMAWLAIHGYILSARKAGAKNNPKSFCTPLFDLPLVSVAATTIAMAVMSRRFIPMAAFVSMPLTMLMACQVVTSARAVRQYIRIQTWEIPSPMPQKTQLKIMVTLWIGLVSFGLWAGLNFKKIYVDPWPMHPKKSSVFMRMTGSWSKPEKAGAFIRFNHMTGNMLNEWSSGGAIAFAQEPDPKTGDIPLKLFIDGRAQAAYERKIFDQWQSLWMTHPLHPVPGLKTTSPNKVPIASALLDEAVKQNKFWVVLLPKRHFSSPLAIALAGHNDWAMVFCNNFQKLYVHTACPKGKHILGGIPSGRTTYPDEFSSHMALGRFFLAHDKNGQNIGRGFEHLKNAMMLNPSPAPVSELFQLTKPYPLARKNMENLFIAWISTFDNNKKHFKGQHGYQLRLEAARLAAVYLNQISFGRNDPGSTRQYAAKAGKYAAELKTLFQEAIW